MKTLTTSLLTALASVGSMFGYYDNKVGALENGVLTIQTQLEQTIDEKNQLFIEKENLIIEKNQAIESKKEILKDYVLSQVKLNESPLLDLTFASTIEMQQAQLDLAKEQGIVVKLDDDVFTRLRQKAVSEGTACTIK